MEKAPPLAGRSIVQGNDGGGKRRPYIYVGNLSPLVSERILSDLFEQAGPVRSTKVVASIHPTGRPGAGYGFVEYGRLASAETALHMFHGYHLFGRPLRLNWAHQGADAGEPIPHGLVQDETTMLHTSTSIHISPVSSTQPPALTRSESHTSSEEGNRLYSVFVGDLAPEINDAALCQAFSIFPSVFDARVVWDLQSHRSRGYGFVRFSSESDALASIATMQGQWLGSRPIRVNWASRRLETRPTFVENFQEGSSRESGPSEQSPSNITAVYVGNLPTEVFLLDVVPHFHAFGPVVSAQIFQERRFAFITLESHDKAVQAIGYYQHHPLIIRGRLVKVGWARFMRRSAE